MKKYFYQFIVALMAISSFTFFACSDDEDDPTTPKDPTVSGSTYYCNLTLMEKVCLVTILFLLVAALWKYHQQTVSRISQYLFTLDIWSLIST